MLSTVFKQGSMFNTLQASNQKSLLKPSELDIYYEPEPSVPAERENPQPEFLYEYVHTARESLTNAFSGLLTTHEKISEVYVSSTGKVKSGFERVLENPYILLPPSSILLATVSGAIVAGKGRRPFRRTLYALVFGTTATAVCYPYRALEIAETGYYHTASSISQLYNSIARAPVTVEKVAVEVNKTEDIEAVSLSEAVKDIEISAERTEESNSNPSLDATTSEYSLNQTELIDTIVPIDSEETTDAISSGYNPNQTELVEITEVPIDSKETTTTKDLTLELVSDSNASDEANNVAEGDHGQSDPEDQNMYSTRS